MLVFLMDQLLAYKLPSKLIGMNFTFGKLQVLRGLGPSALTGWISCTIRVLWSGPSTYLFM